MSFILKGLISVIETYCISFTGITVDTKIGGATYG